MQVADGNLYRAVKWAKDIVYRQEIGNMTTRLRQPMTMVNCGTEAAAQRTEAAAEAVVQRLRHRGCGTEAAA